MSMHDDDEMNIHWIFMNTRRKGLSILCDKQLLNRANKTYYYGKKLRNVVRIILKK